MYDAASRDRDPDLIEYDVGFVGGNIIPPYQMGPPDQKPAFIVWGDSHAGAWVPAIRELAREYGVAGLALTCSGCPPLLDFDIRLVPFCRDFNEHVVATVKDSGLKHVILASSCLTSYADDLPTAQEPDKGLEIITEHLVQTIEQLQESGAVVWLVRPVPVFPFEPPKQLLKAAKRDIPASEVYLPAADYRKLDEIYAAAEKHGARVLPITPDVCGRDVCPTGDAGGVYYRDSNHLSVYGALHFKDTFKPLMETIIKDRARKNQASPSGF